MLSLLGLPFVVVVLTARWVVDLHMLQNGGVNGIVPSQYKSPEYKEGTWDTVVKQPPWAIDMWMLACLIYDIYNVIAATNSGSAAGTPASAKLQTTADLKKIDKIPKVIIYLHLSFFCYYCCGVLFCLSNFASFYLTLLPSSSSLFFFAVLFGFVTVCRYVCVAGFNSAVSANVAQ